MMAAWLVVIEHRLHIHLTREKTRRPSTGLSPGERHEITDAPPERSCHDSAIPRARSSRWHSARSSGAMDARSRRLSSCPGFRPLGCTPDTATARCNCPPTCLARRARLHVGSCRIFPLNTAANPAPAHCIQATLARSVPATEHEATRPHCRVGRGLCCRGAIPTGRTVARRFR